MELTKVYQKYQHKFPKWLMWTKTCKITSMVIKIITTKNSREGSTEAQAGQVKCFRGMSNIPYTYLIKRV